MLSIFLIYRFKFSDFIKLSAYNKLHLQKDRGNLSNDNNVKYNYLVENIVCEDKEHIDD